MAKKKIKTLVANRIQLTNLKGEPRITLDASREDCAYIHVLNAKRESCIALTVFYDLNESAIEIQNKVGMNSSGEGGGALTIRGEDGRLSITMFEHPDTKEPSIYLYERPNKVRRIGKK